MVSAMVKKPSKTKEKRFILWRLPILTVPAELSGVGLCSVSVAKNLMWEISWPAIYLGFVVEGIRSLITDKGWPMFGLREATRMACICTSREDFRKYCPKRFHIMCTYSLNLLCSSSRRTCGDAYRKNPVSMIEQTGITRRCIPFPLVNS